MDSTSPVIAAIDFSPSSSFVLRHAVRAAQNSGAPVHAIHVLDAGILNHWASNPSRPFSADQLAARAEERLRNLAHTECPEAEISVEVHQGRPAEKLHQAIKALGARLLVIAANDLTKKRLGSIASRCVRSAPCNVLVIRDWQDGPFTKLVACTDFSRTAAKALQRAINLAKSHGAALQLVHVMYPPTEDPWGETLEHHQDSVQSYQEECEERVEQQMAAILKKHQFDLASISHETVILQSSRPSMALTSYIEKEKPDLVILGTRRQSGIAGLFIGTNAERLLEDVPVSVLAVRD